MLLPVVQRELLVSSRQRMTFYWRMLSAGVQLPIFAALYGLHLDNRAFSGSHILLAMSTFVFVEAMLAGVRFTSDCLSEEKREGTLGLLFLTDLGGLDIVLGKVAARALGAFFNILATFPILALNLFIGGVTGEQVAAICLTLTVSVLFSLAAGALVSSRGERERNVLLGTFLMLTGITFAPLLLNEFAVRIVGYYGFVDTLVHLSPYHALIEAQRGFVPQLNRTLVTLLALTAAFLAYAAWRIRHRFGEPITIAVPESIGVKLRRMPRRISGYVGSPLDWLAQQNRVRKSRLVMFSLFLLCFGFFCRIVFEENLNWAVPIVFLGSYGLHLTYKFFLTAETCRQLNEDRRSGALELILVTPAKAAHLVRAQLSATWRAWVPVGVCLAFMNYLWLSHREFDRQDVFQIALPITIILLITDTIMLPWRAILEAIRGDRYPATVFKAFLRSMGPPIAVFAFLVAISIVSSERAAANVYALWAFATVIFNLMLISNAKKELQNFRLIASGEKLVRQSLRPASLRSRFQLPVPIRRI
ncbi:MAG TPA: hypothetical protein VF773_10595 [Verrucomicrobiae bacterium]